jgi:predicted transcriptional regulator
MMRIEIVEDLKKRREEDTAYVKAVLRGKKIDRARAEKTIIMTPEIFAKVFSPQRTRLLLKIRQNHIKNIHQLAQELGRKYEAVHRDIAFLAGLGIVHITEKKNQRIPFIDEPVQTVEFAV